MKKLLLLSVLSLIIIASCKKKDGAVSITVTAAFPTITFTGTQFFTIPVGGLRPTISATAYDSFYKESCTIVVIDSTVHNLVPGLYIAKASAKNHYGFVTYVNYYVAVTNIPDSMNLSGHWFEPTFIPTGPDSAGTDIQKLARGLYFMTNVNGVNFHTDSADNVSDYFAVIDDTTISFVANTGVLSLVAGDTTISYTSSLGTSVFFTKK